MTINYSNYTVDELLEVDERIDKDKHPQLYKKLCDEIQRRKENGEFEEKKQELDDENIHSSFNLEYIIEFSKEGSGKTRKIFILMFTLINIISLSFLIPKYIVPDLSSTHKYLTKIDSIECDTREIVNSETDDVYEYSDLNLTSYQDNFYAIGISRKKCKVLSNNLTVGSDVFIWHDNGLIYQLKFNNETLLSYNYMKPRILQLKTDDVLLYSMYLIAFWGLFFKSLVNAISPGTFVSKS